MDVKQACFYLADRAFLVTDYKDFTETEAGDPRVKSLWHQAPVWHPSLFTDPLFFL